MSRVSLRWLGYSLPVLLWIGLTASQAASLHVAPATQGGDDANAGTLAAPFLTIQKAADVAVAGDTVYVRAGTYRETVTPLNSGTAQRPITYQPYGDGDVIISGAEILTNWSPGGNSTYETPLPSGYYPSIYNYALQVFVNGEMLNLARWPNTPHDDLSFPRQSTLTTFVSKTRDNTTRWTTVVFEDENCPFATVGQHLLGAKITVQPSFHAWSWTSTGTVQQVQATASGGTRFTTRTRNDGGRDGRQEVYDVGAKYYVFDLPVLLDSPGEFYHDSSAGQLVLRCPEDASPLAGSTVVEVRKRDFAFNLDGKAHIVVQGFHLFACTITTDVLAANGIGHDPNGYDVTSWRGVGAPPPAAHHIVLDGIHAKYVSHYTDQSGHFFMQFGINTGFVVGGSDNVVRNCDIQYSAGNGISLYGARSKALNNRISDVSYNQQDGAGIATHGGADPSYDLEIAYNTITRTGRSAITLRSLYNSVPGSGTARVHHNDLSRFMIQDSDGGGIYTFGIPSGFVRMDHNRIHDGYGSARGIYTDYASQFIIDHNVIWNVQSPLYLLVSSDLLVYNNTLVDLQAGYDFQGFLFGVRDNNSGSVMQNNLAVTFRPTPGPGGESNQWYIGESPRADSNNLKWDGRHGSSTDPRFADLLRHDYRLTAASSAYHAGTVVQDHTFVIDGRSIFVPAYNDPNDGAPNIGAHQGAVASAPSPGANLAASRAATASSTKVATGFGLSLLTDGVINSTPANIGWSSASNLHAPHVEWAQLDLGSPQTIARVDVFPRNDGPTAIWGWDRGNIGRGLPGRLTLQASNDPTFSSGVVTLAEEDIVYERPHGFAIRFAPASARYLRLVGDELIGFPYDENVTKEYTLQFGELRVYAAAGGDPAPPSAPPAEPSAFTATAVAADRIILVWQDNAFDESGFSVERSGDGVTGWTEVALTLSDVLTVTDPGLSPSTAYHYRVRATNATGDSPFTAVATATTFAAPSAPAAPSGLSATAGSSNHIVLAWTDNANDESGFELERSPDGTTNWTTIANPAADATGYSDNGLSASTAYHYRVRAINAIGASAFSAPAFATTQAPGSDVTAGLVGRWEFDENTGVSSADTSGNHNPATAASESTFPSWTTTARLGPAALVFNGANAVQAAHSSALNVTSGLTITVWIRPSSWSTGDRLIVFKGRYGWQHVWHLGKNGANQMAFWLKGINGGTDGQVAVSTLPALDHWTHLAATYDSSTGQARVYYNGIQQGVATFPTKTLLQTFNEALRIGTGENPGSFIGTLDSLRIYNRALSAAEVETVAAWSPAPPPPAPTGLTATAVSASQITLAWTDSSSIETGFNLERSPDGVTGWTEIAGIAANQTSYTDTGLFASTSYHYRLRATNAVGHSVYTAVVHATTGAPGPIARWRFDQTLLAENSAYDATAVGSVGYAAGKIGGQSVTLDGNSANYLVLPFVLDPAGNFTVTAWVYLTADAGTANQTILQQEGGTGRSWLYRKADGTLGSFLGATDTLTTGVIPLGQWTHVALVNTGGTLRLYLDAVLDGSASRIIESSTGSMRVGAHKSGATANWNGRIDDLRIYDVALDTASIVAIRNYTESSGVQNFRTLHGLPADGSQDTAMPAGDGVPNLLKYAFNMVGSGVGQAFSLSSPNATPLTPTGSAGLPFVSLLPAPDSRLQLTYIRRKAASYPGITYSVEFSSDLAADSWAANPSATETATSLDATFDRVAVTDSLSSPARRFARVRVTANP